MDLAIVLVSLAVAAAVIVVITRVRRRARRASSTEPSAPSTAVGFTASALTPTGSDERIAPLAAHRLRPLTAEGRERYSEDWRTVQARFCEQPAIAVADAELLIQELLRERGFPVHDFEERKADIAVYYPQVVESYRQARLIAERNRSAQATTDDLR